MYSELTDSSSRMRRIVSASKPATDNCADLAPHALGARVHDSGIVSVTTSSSSAEPRCAPPRCPTAPGG